MRQRGKHVSGLHKGLEFSDHLKHKALWSAQGLTLESGHLLLFQHSLVLLMIHTKQVNLSPLYINMYQS
jgi:hypothetical protein